MVVRYQGGVTLVELLIVVAIVAILAGVAYPSYQSHISRTRYADAKVMLIQIMQRQRKFFTDNNNFADNLIASLGYVDAGGGDVATENGFYLISVGQCGALAFSECVQLTATPTFVGGGDTLLTYNSRNEKAPAAYW